MDAPRFAAHLPSGKFLDWAWTRNPGRRNQFGATPGIEAVTSSWDELDDAEVARLAGASEDTQVLEWIAAHGLRRSGVRAAILRNPALPYAALREIVERGTNAAEREGIANTRSAQDLCDLLVAGHRMSTNPRQIIGWLVSGIVAEGSHQRILDEVGDLLAGEHLPTLVTEILRTEPGESGFPLETLLTLIETEVGPALQENSWRSLGQHLAARGTVRQVRRSLQLTNSTALRSALVNARRITLTQAFARMDTDHRATILRQLSPERPLTELEAPLVAAVAAEMGDETKAARALLHGLHYEPGAVTWLLANTAPAVAGTVVWHADSDPVLISVLRRNPASHHYAAAHIWRAGRVWERLSTRTRTSIVSGFDALTLSNLAPGPIREWIVNSGPIGAVSGLTLRKTEQRTLMDRVERERDAELAWVGARIAERPRDRVRMAEIGLGSERWEQGVRQWLRGATSGEITKLWSVTEPAKRGPLGALLVANLRGSDETSWLDRVTPELRIEWQQAPQPVQEAAAHWIANRCGNDPEVWNVIWSLYPEWTGTLPELLEAATNV